MAIHPHAPGTYKPTQPDKVFYFGVPHNLQKPESYRPCHSLNPYRHRTLCTRGLLLLYIGQTTRDKCTVIPVILLWLCLQKAPSTRNLQTYTAWQSFLLWSPTQPGAARRFQGMPQPQWAGFTRGWQAAVWQIYWDHLQGINVLLFLLCCYGCTTPNLHAPETFKSTQTDKVFYFGVPYTAWSSQKVTGHAIT